MNDNNAKPSPTSPLDNAMPYLLRPSAAVRRDYGVAIEPEAGTIDEARTEQLRAALRRERGDGPAPFITR
jgi:hypothetical protein